ncbi:MAG TPA: sialidase family protein [Candidatus Dormibacteraeota bacterium]
MLAIAVACMSAMLNAASTHAASLGRPQVDANVPVTAVNLEQGADRAHNSPVLAQNPADPAILALASRVDVPQFSCTLTMSGDGGRSWVPATPVPVLPSGAQRCYAPQVAFDRTGRLYYLFVGLHGLGNQPMGVFITTSTDNGQNFDTPRNVLPGNNFQVRMVLDQSVGDQGRIYLAWLHVTAPTSTGGLPPVHNPILVAHSDNGGATFSAPVEASDADRHRVVDPALAIGPNHAVHVLYYDLVGDARDYEGLEGTSWPEPWTLVMANSTDSGAHFGRGVVVDDDVVPPERVLLIFTMPEPALAADQQGRVFAGWYDARNADWDVFMRRSLDGGNAWVAAQRLNDDPVGDGKNQYLPVLRVAPTGRIDAVFEDRRNDPDNVKNDVYYTYSNDGGATWSPNVRLSSASSDTTIGARYPIPSAQGLVDFGGHPALLSTKTGIVAAWTDTRNAQPGEEQDIFATQANWGTDATPLGPAVAGFGATDIALIVGGAVALIGAGTVVVWQVGRPRRTPAGMA